MKDFWNLRYQENKFAYGLYPNRFFKSVIDRLNPGILLLPAEGEGRNAVYAAKSGWKVDAFDISDTAKKHAEELADKNRVKINYFLSSYQNLNLHDKNYHLIALIYAHIPVDRRRSVHQELIKYLLPGGKIILEAFDKEQINNQSGGPKNLDLLYQLDDKK